MLSADTINLPAVQRWRLSAVLLAGFLFGFFALYWETVTSLVGMWEGSENYRHAYVVPPISAWLIWQKRREVLACVIRPSPMFLLPLLTAALMWLIGELAATNALRHFALVSSLVLLVPALLGMQVAKVLIFPLGFLVFAVPFGEFLFPVLTYATADVTVAALRLSGIPVFREGLQFVIPTGHWSVIEACSGLRYLIASVMVGTLFAYLNYQSLSKRLVFVGASIVVPIIANWVRAYLVVLVAHLTGNELGTGVDHIIAGWIFFGIVTLSMFMIGSRFADHEGTSQLGVPISGPANAANERSARQTFTMVALAAALVLGVPHIASTSIKYMEKSGEPVLTPIALAADGWLEPISPESFGWDPSFLQPSAVLKQTFNKDGHVLGLYVGYYRHQDASRKLVSDQNQLVRTDNKQWSEVSVGRTQFELGDKALALNTSELRSNAGQGAPEERLQVWQLYWVNGHWTASKAGAKAFGVLYRLLGRGDDGATVVLYIPKRQGVDGETVAASFLKANLAAIDRELQRARATGSASN